ncbi:MAG TPA: hypothetical protein PKE63_01635 [Lacibacter sp.]|nr:hypothetical protein [Lacibacter sp.]HMO88857.1 hypothetical protein [Lacibacter sp.]HMP85945.1 hypothetical protein [Lacibacter sp.]
MKLSKAALLAAWLLVLGTGILYYPRWEKTGTEATLSWDVFGYYLYLPATVIYGDLPQLGFRDKVLRKYQPTPDFQQAYQHPSGNYVIKYPAGQAVLMAPFFLAGHYIAKKTTYLNDGFSYPYQACIGIGMLFYACLGLWVLRKILLRYFDEGATGLTLLTVAFATNYLNYAAIDGAMTHNTLFTLYALLVWTTIRFYEAPSLLRAVLIGALVGLNTLTRPTELLSVVLPLFWGIGSLPGLRERIGFFRTHYRYLIAAAIPLVSIGSLQLLYWHHVTGSWLVYSYEEGFDWTSPHWWDGWFSVKSGWLIYSPAMGLAVIGFVFLYRRHRTLFPAVLLFSLVFVYLCTAWQNWWYGGSLGIRAMVQAYAVLSLPLAAFFQWLLQRPFAWRAVTGALLLFCTVYNGWLTHQAHAGGLLRPGEMTPDYLRAIFLRNQVQPEAQFLLDNPHVLLQPPVASTEIFRHDFDADTTTSTTSQPAIRGRSAFVNGPQQFTPELNFYPPAERGRARWLRASALFYAPEKEWTTWRMCQFVMKFYNGEHLVQSNMIRVFRTLEAGETRRLHLDARIPEDVFDRVAVFLWNAGSERLVLMDELKVWMLED